MLSSSILHVSETLNIPTHYLRQSNRENVIEVNVHKTWIRSLLRTAHTPDFIPHDSFGEDEVLSWVQQGEDLGVDWQRFYMRVMIKPNKLVIPLPRLRRGTTSEDKIGDSVLSFGELIHYVSHTNHRNLWKDIFKRHCPDRNVSKETNDESHINLVSSDLVLRDIIYRTYGCPVITLSGCTEPDAALRGHRNMHKLDPHCNILPALAAVETDSSYIVILQPYLSHTLQDCVSFSPAVLGSCNTKPLFIIYQLLEAMCALHDRGLILGNIQLCDILLSENLWIQIMPLLEDNIHEIPLSHDEHHKKILQKHSEHIICENRRPEFRRCDYPTTSLNKVLNHPSNSYVRLEEAVHLWVSGQMSNFEYLTLLNHLAGRRLGDPTRHHVLPWVTDFTASGGLNWRDLTRSKFRLNKGDRQLDLTYDIAPGSAQVPHHVSDVLSDITYYVYLSRRTPKPVLCKIVRSTWVPAEYPSSIQRMQEWTPDECIPEFFTEPSVFKSVHDDLPDLEVPSWAASPEDFIERHREMLESPHVSERLNHWIDLTFGYKLSGAAAVKSKNVCLHLVDSHTTLSTSGVVQLFAHPHPQKNYDSVYWGKVPPRIFSPPRTVKVDREMADEYIGGSGFEDEDQSLVQASTASKSSPLAFSRLLSRSRGSLATPSIEDIPPSNASVRSAPGGANPSAGANAVNGGTIYLPRDFHPTSALQALESLHTFIGKTFHRGQLNEPSRSIECDQRSGSKYKLQIVASKRQKEMQVLGCLLVELFLAGRLHAVSTSSEERLQICQSAARHCGDQLPRCVRHIISMLLQIPLSQMSGSSEEGDVSYPGTSSNVKYPPVTPSSLPPPSAHQLLQPLLSSMLIPFPPQFQTVFHLLKKNQEYAALAFELSCRSEDCAGQEPDLCLIAEKLSECWVKSIALDLTRVLPQLDPSLTQLVLPHIRQLMEDASTAVLSTWYLFDPMAQALGPTATCSHLLDSILKLYSEFRLDENVKESGCGMDTGVVPIHSHKQAKLFHRSFLLRLIIRFGLKAFIENFVPVLVEAVGGYHETSRPISSVKMKRRLTPAASHLESCRLDEPISLDADDIPEDSSSVKPLGAEGFLSPMDEELPGSESRPSIVKGSRSDLGRDSIKVEVEPEMFVLDTDEDAAPLDHLIKELDLHPDDGEDGEEIALCHPNIYLCDSGNSLKSPTISIPVNSGEATSLHRNISRSTDGDNVDDDDDDVDGVDDRFINDISFGSIADTYSDNQCTNAGSSIMKSDQKFKVSDVSAESLLWLAHRLGPVLTARCLSRNLLRMLTLSYLKEENLQPVSSTESFSSKDPKDSLKIVGWTIVGDRNASNVLECLSSIAALYGEQLIVLQYFPYMGELLSLCRRKLTFNLEAGMIGCLALLRHIVPFLTDSTLMDQLQDVILKTILYPAVRLLSTTRLTYPSGWIGRMAFTTKFCEALYLLSLRLGREMTNRHLTVPALQRFFLTFSKAHHERENALALSATPNSNTSGDLSTLTIEGATPKETAASSLRSLEESNYLEIRRDGTTTEWAVRRGIPVQITHVRSHSRAGEGGSVDSYSPPVTFPKPQSVDESCKEQVDSDRIRPLALEELRAVFSPRLAHLVYIPFFRFLGESVVEQALKNHLFIQDLCFEYEQEMQHAAPSEIPVDTMYLSDYLSPPTPLDMERAGSGSFGTNVALIGNRIELQRPDIQSSGVNASQVHSEVMTLASLCVESNTTRHLRGNWLAYWEHEIGRSEKESRFNFKQIKLQTFAGHTNSVRSIVALGNENSFLSASRDKTVKLWSLRSQGDGSTVSQCQWNYTGHRKSIISLTFVESLRLVASSDSGVQLWDPWLGRVVSGQPGVAGGSTAARSPPPINVLRALPAPSAAILAATTDSTLRMLDARVCSFVNQLKVSLTPVGLIRCMAIGPSGYWAAVGQSSGFLTLLDIRTGLVIASWKGHEGEVLQLVAVNESTLISSSLDQTVSVWNAVDGKLRFHLRGPTEPVHCLGAYCSELISGTTANRIGVHTAIDSTSSFSSTRLRSDAFRGVLTTMAVLPLNRLLLLGADNGTIHLLC